jgi:hypothetical protein
MLSPRHPDPGAGVRRHPRAGGCRHGFVRRVAQTGRHGQSHCRRDRHSTEILMTQQDAPSGLRRNADHNRTDALTDPDFQSVVLIILIGFLITACLASAFPLDDNAINAIAVLS